MQDDKNAAAYKKSMLILREERWLLSNQRDIGLVEVTAKRFWSVFSQFEELRLMETWICCYGTKALSLREIKR